MLCILVVLSISVILGTDCQEAWYKCDNGHVFKRPKTKTVMDYEGFEEDVMVCPDCGCDETFYKEFINEGSNDNHGD
ncbi:hypothetical protein BVSY1_17480 [Bacillus velezensis]|nr:hypothetical protein BVSY1_17480 [Bacillus velezensis]